jgi:hypothetical protein
MTLHFINQKMKKYILYFIKQFDICDMCALPHFCVCSEAHCPTKRNKTNGAFTLFT